MQYNQRLLLKGNEAAVYGALLAGCDCFFGYPITPASEVAHTAVCPGDEISIRFAEGSAKAKILEVK